VNYLDLPKIDDELRADILLFDYWVQNGDRILEPCGGNPNLLWHAVPENVVMIDHNGAFEDNFSQIEFFKTHIFRESSAVWGESFRQNRQQKILEILGKLPDTCALLPEAWYADDELTGFSAELARMKRKRLIDDPLVRFLRRGILVTNLTGGGDVFSSPFSPWRFCVAFPRRRESSLERSGWSGSAGRRRPRADSLLG